MSSVFPSSVLFAPHLRADSFKDTSEQGYATASPPVSMIARLGTPSVFSFRAACSLLRAVKRAGVVHISLAREPLPTLALLLALLLRKPVVAQPHGMLTSRSSIQHRILDLVLGPLIRRADVTLALTNKERTDLERRFSLRPGSIVVLGNPLLRGVVAPNPDNSRQVPPRLEALFLARLHARKRVGVFADAAATALELGWPEQYALIGPDQGELQAALDRQLPNLRYEGTLPPSEVPARLTRAGVFVLTADAEPWGNVLVAALSSGVPVVVSESSALADTIRAHGAGIVTPDGEVGAVATAIHQILHSSDYKKFSEAALRLSDREFTDDAVRRTLTKVYETRSHSTAQGSQLWAQD
ncbi:glycosyltransferase [Curtobacterium sp. BRD11]|uniref:glycosyltransferase n=1 Tax=Curtobacterium sp. BRD11 TaxID=2962581 RepID=UPI002881C5AD|nr:glycosyltransferase [Curtobacterium sp. BRD11]MDT0211473.1 glycosyltransferase [Curtobacterium sp. BRD11]